MDDSALILERLSQMINRVGKGWNLILAGTFGEALDCLQRSTINVAIFDIHLQEENGIKLLQIALHLHPDLFAIMLTNHADSEVKAVCITIGAKHCLDKSLDFPHIPQIISSLH